VRFQLSNCKSRVSTWLVLLAASLAPCVAQPKSELNQPPPLDPAEGRKQAAALVANLLKLAPSENATQRLTLTIEDAEDRKRLVPARFEIICTPTNFLSIYQAQGESKSEQMALTIIRENGRNKYLISQPAGASPAVLCADQLSLPFAGSDFWVIDLGLEFLHWPQQRILTKQMRRYVFCDKLESINPEPGKGTYSKVISWIGANRPDEFVLVHAEAYDHQGKLLKVFDPRKLEKVNGTYQLDQMEIRNRQRHTRTLIDFELPGEK
jgi:outer membrane lipoprotein-sorting protein